MADFIDPRRFRDDDELFAYIVEHLVKPKIREALGNDDGEFDRVSGAIYVFGGRGGVDPEVIERIQGHLQEGLDLDYVLDELCDLHVRSAREATIGELKIRYVEVAQRDGDDVEPLTADELEAMYRLE